MKAIADGADRRQADEQNGRAWTAWHVAVLSRSRKIPELSRLQVKIGAARKTQTREQQIRAAKMIAAMFGGEVRKRGKVLPNDARHEAVRAGAR